MTLPLLSYCIYYIHCYTTFHHLVQLPCFLQSKQDQLFGSIPMNNEIYHPKLIEHNNDFLHRHIGQSCVEYRPLSSKYVFIWTRKSTLSTKKVKMIKNRRFLWNYLANKPSSDSFLFFLTVWIPHSTSCTSISLVRICCCAIFLSLWPFKCSFDIAKNYFSQKRSNDQDLQM